MFIVLSSNIFARCSANVNTFNSHIYKIPLVSLDENDTPQYLRLGPRANAISLSFEVHIVYIEAYMYGGTWCIFTYHFSLIYISVYMINEYAIQIYYMHILLKFDLMQILS